MLPNCPHKAYSNFHSQTVYDSTHGPHFTKLSVSEHFSWNWVRLLGLREKWSDSGPRCSLGQDGGCQVTSPQAWGLRVGGKAQNLGEPRSGARLLFNQPVWAELLWKENLTWDPVNSGVLSKCDTQRRGARSPVDGGGRRGGLLFLRLRPQLRL